eukprot:CAMPEP_0183291498 /NCGR_PEP_ID=MMETSP0160_2-20130417/893_1 /TAXON_ID=2839 ORGANISM="Odontella Sinensis, Strain Grunow 1884" /NCGR_SAMPLE_ID=MMETSP0160_2 /ASSEMBLY_ACC=CAM_ASM_000250 /LENGTH=543 /DNA_ID=CAMNT_0025452313 /DNA_START=74 /DNA_END=1705 /DNA_ORIENTATION=+
MNTATTEKRRLAQYGAVPVASPDFTGDDNVLTAESWAWVNARKTELDGEEEDGEGGGSPAKIRDFPFAVLFVAQLVAMIVVGGYFGSWGSSTSSQPTHYDDDELEQAMEKMEETVADVEAHSLRILSYLVIPCGAIAFLMTYVGTAVVIPSFSELAVGACLAASVVLPALLVLLSLLSGAVGAAIPFGIILAITIWYVRRIWPMVPFAAANLTAALKGMSSNWGVYLIAVMFSVLSAVWVVFWSYAANGIFAREAAGENGESHDGVFWLTMFLLLVSLYWTTTVMLNTIQTSVAGVIGTWCFNKTLASGCCSLAVTSSLYRSLTYSFGSICLGSLFEALIRALRVLSDMARDDDGCSSEGRILVCILQCILSCFESMIEYFNQWAYVFVGVYGYGYVESGKKVMELFKARGFTAIITNDLVGYVLRFTAMVVAILTGLMGVALEAWTKTYSAAGGSFLFGQVEGAGVWAFFVAFLVGLFVSSVMTNAIVGAVNAIIVCYADAPGKLEENHRELTHRMATAWVSAFPECGIVVPAKEPTAAVLV